jgi:hypothetical protein
MDLELAHMQRIVRTVEREARELSHSFEKYKRDPQRYAPQKDNFLQAARTIESTLRVLTPHLASTDALKWKER